MSDPELPDESDAVDESGEPFDETQTVPQKRKDALLRAPRIDPFAGLDVGKIMPSIDFSQFVTKIDWSANLPKIDHSQFVTKIDPAIFDTFTKIDFGAKPIVDAAVLKSLANVFDTKRIFPPGFFDAFTRYKFPELALHPEAIRAIDAITIEPRRKVAPRPDEVAAISDAVIDAEIIEGETGSDVGLIDHAARQTAALERVTDLLAQSLIDAADAHADARASNAAANRSERSKFIVATSIGACGLVLALVSVLVTLALARVI